MQWGPVMCKAITMWGYGLPMDTWRNGPGNKLWFGAKSFFRRKRQLGVTFQFSTWKWEDYRVCPEWEEITSVADKAYDLSVGDCPVSLGVGSSWKRTGKGGRVILVQAAAVQSLPLLALILEHSLCFGTLWNLPYFLAYTNTFLPPLGLNLFCVCSFFKFYVLLQLHTFAFLWLEITRTECNFINPKNVRNRSRKLKIDLIPKENG